MAYVKPSAGRGDKRQNTTNYEHPQETNLLDLHRAMAYDPYGAPVLRIDDTTKQHTSKNRVKVSGLAITTFNSYQYTKDPDVWDEALTGTATSTLDTYFGMVNMTVGGTAGDQVIRQTRRVVRYIPGRQSEVSMSVLFGPPTAGIRRRFGIYDELNGAYFEDAGDGTYYVVCRRNTAAGIIEERVARADWNSDRLDGTGPSGITANPLAIQLMVIEYEWYGAGQVEFKFIINNNAYPVHKFEHGNISLIPWASTAFLPIRAELTNVTGTAGSHTFYVGSTSASSEGDVGALGIELNAASPITGRSLAAANTFYPVLSIRLKSDRLQGVVIPIDLQASTLDNTQIYYRLVQNPTLTEASWVSVGADSFVEYDASATAAANGTILKTAFLGTYQQGQLIRLDPRVLYQLGRTSMGTASDILTVEIAATNANKAGFASLNWIEIR